MKKKFQALSAKRGTVTVEKKAQTGLDTVQKGVDRLTGREKEETLKEGHGRKETMCAVEMDAWGSTHHRLLFVCLLIGLPDLH